MIEVLNLEKSYGDVKALAGISFAVKPREVIGLLGPNGAGKTTLMKILAGFLHPEAGTARIGGYDVLEDPVAVQAMLGYLPENAPLYPELSVQAHLKMMADLRGIPAAEQRRKLSVAVHAVGLADRLTRPVSTLSKGFRQRVGLAQAILHNPRLLILDEPTNGLDPTQIVEVRHLIRKLARHSTVMVSTHILSEVEATCDRAIIIMQGQVRADATMAGLAATADVVLILEKNGQEAVTLAALSTLAGVRAAAIDREAAGRVVFRMHGATAEDFCPAVYRLAREHDWPLCELKREVPSLETVFNRIAAGPGGVQ
ncbi:MAG: hypothetical protein COX17_06220 [Deltaproteobacteria bacterium CG23_combo_of_CG06-09_8_20_14_all_60_8]|nr:MAG: hypothetical protein AUK28_11020 [Desulfobacterales bacterium CG2_30_60_27]PIP43572.1 MAG: hypothetical protein COX17_06220 [Deltaproteobacteria bacterium CG23_combo_of_CG06-09_8_20_14_all_60_8]